MTDGEEGGRRRERRRNSPVSLQDVHDDGDLRLRVNFHHHDLLDDLADIVLHLQGPLITLRRKTGNGVGLWGDEAAQVAVVLTFLLSFHSDPLYGEYDIRQTTLHLSPFWSLSLFLGSWGPCTITVTLLNPCSKYAEPSAVGTTASLCLRVRISPGLLPSKRRPASARMSAFCIVGAIALGADESMRAEVASPTNSIQWQAKIDSRSNAYSLPTNNIQDYFVFQLHSLFLAQLHNLVLLTL